MDLSIRLANINIYIHSVYDLFNDNIKEYTVPDMKVPDIEIISNKSLIDAEYERLQISNNDIESLESVEMILIQRLIAEMLPNYNAFLLHGAAIAVNNETYIFSARSGTGKTTHIQHWLEKIDNACVVNGDKPYILINEKGAFACGTPWCGKEKMGTNTIQPIRSIVFMERSIENRMEKVDFKTALPRLLEQTYHPVDAVQMKKMLKLLLKLKNLVTFYIFYFDNFKEDVFQVSYNTLAQQKSSNESMSDGEYVKTIHKQHRV